MTDALEQAKQDFVQHITGDQVLSSVYTDLMAVRKNDGTNLMDPAVASKYNADLADFNATVQQYLPNFTLLGTLDGNHMLFSEKGVTDPVNVDCSAAIPLKAGDLVTPSAGSNPLDVINNGSAGNGAKSDSTAARTDSTTNNPVLNTGDSTAISPSIPGDSTVIKQPVDSTVIKQPVDSTAAKSPDGSTTKDGTKDDSTKDDGTKNDGTKGDGTKPDAKEQAAKQTLLDLATQKVGEGPWQAAERLLPGGSYQDLKALTHLLKAYFQEHNDDHTDKLVKLKVGNHWLTEENLQEILDKSDALKKRFNDLQKS